MKKTVLLFVMVLMAAGAQSQLVSKKNIPILPESGEWALGFNADPFFGYLGNMFNGTTENSPPFVDFVSGQSPLTLSGKYVRDEGMFYRVRLRLGCGTGMNELPIAFRPTIEDTIDFNEELVYDESKSGNTDINLGAGIEWRKGKGRVQGYYGPEIVLGFSKSKSSFEFANPTDSTMTAGSFNIFNFTADPNAISASGKRIVETSSGSTFSFEVRAFIGVEFFYMPKASIGGEFGWGIGISRTGRGETTTEYFEPELNNDAGGIRTETIETPGKSTFWGFDTDNASGAVNLNFYF